ncbi:putative protein related to capsule biosynthesis enzyme-like protein [Caballeronia hypogeia]|uniref:HipA-like C-terminal domain-containing protein n=1 Tax=Caballeronia hypogeia TaxID=1777140 RepID=A0A158AC79_9BURK|nr:type II toxin-antitoxin system HipA family toxin [Caballeronia hypogeia]SAK55451.1 putative protein related to capsule biosynthesis enzyme-like protein [Caballeronia hypogeia]
MTSKISRLCVFANMDASWTPCGQLALTEDATDLVASGFEYDPAYLNRSAAFDVDPVSLRLGNRKDIAGKVLRPANSLPYFGAIRDATPDAWGRRIIEAKLGAPLNGLPESQYLLHAGSDRVGALDVRPKASAPAVVAKDTWDTLPDIVEAVDLIERGQPVPPSLDNIYVQAASLGGARPKASIRDEKGRLHLAKLASEGDRFDVPAVEHATLRLAERAGLRVPAVRLVRVNDRNVLLVRRFDRYWAVSGNATRLGDSRFVRGDKAKGEIEHRVPFVSALTVAGCDETESRNMSYAMLGSRLQRYCRTLVAYDGQAELFKRMIFNIFISNSDDHLRNFGFLWDTELRSWRLSPVYDVLPQPGIASERFQHLAVGKSGRLATLDNALSDHEAFQVSEACACELIADVWAAVRNWRALFESSGVAQRDIDAVQSAFRHIDDVSSADLRRALP